ncbi:MAG: sulfotransferase [Pirellulales bacterium]
MRFRDAFLRRLGPGAFSGATIGSWLKVLSDNRASIDAAFWPRAAWITLAAVPNTLVAIAERCRYGRAIDRTEIEPPLFILGTWRSGTTHLHNLLCVDDRFAYPNLYQVTCPSTFLLSERGMSRLVDWCMPKRRPQDAVKFGVKEPQEEDFAMCSLSGQASMLTMSFPRNVAFYERFMTMEGLSPSELARWKACYLFFLKKLTFKYRRPIVLKTPANTARIKTLLELFPEAKFVHIHRHPYDVFRSAKHTLLKAGPWWQLQRPNYRDDEAINRQLIEQGKILYHSFFAQRSLIPAGRLHDVAFEDLERDAVSQIRSTYDALDLPDFGYVKERLCAYVNSLSDYKKNIFPELPDGLRHRVHHEWRRCFDEWGYVA